MKIFVAGATGVLGRSAVSALIAVGHDVTGVARSNRKAELVREMGAEPVTVDLFDPDAVTEAVRGHDVVCGFATHIPLSARSYFRRSAWAVNDRLHRDVSRHLVDAALAAGATHYLQHSAAFQYADGGTAWLDEDAALSPPPHGHAILEAEDQTRRFIQAGGAGVALRFGYFYGPDAPSTRDLVRIARLGFVPFAGPPQAYQPWIHTTDLGTAVVAALQAPAGIFNVVDDEPITRQTLGGVLAQALGKTRLRPPPRMFTRLLGKRYEYISRSQRPTNARFRSATGWSPTVRTSREGWPATVQALRQK